MPSDTPLNNPSVPPVPPLADRVARVLADLAIEVLDAEREATGVDEWDESDTRCYLYNAAYAVIEGRPVDALDYEQADYPCLVCGTAASCVGGCRTYTPEMG